MLQPDVIVPVYGTEHSYDFYRPNTVRALAAFDPNLRLVYNRMIERFQVMRVVPRLFDYHVRGFGDIAWVQYRLAWERDISHHEMPEAATGVEKGDKPGPLILELARCDSLEHPEETTDDWAWDRIIEQREKLEAKAHEEWRHAWLDNRRLLMKAYEPLFNQPTFVR